VTDAPHPAAAPFSPLGPPRRSVESRPNPRLALLEAIQERDARLTRLLADRWVHRRGIAALEAFQRITLARVEGSEACLWFRAQLELSPPAGAAAPVSEALPDDLISAAALPSVDEAFAALAAEFSSPTAAELAAIADRGLDAVEESLLPPPTPPLSLSFEIPGGATPAVEGPPPVLVESQSEAALEAADPTEPVAGAPASDDVRPLYRRSLGKVRGLLRDCLEEVVASLRSTASTPTDSAREPLDATLPFDTLNEPQAPQPVFHPTAAILASLPAPDPVHEASTGPSRWLPRLAAVPSPRRAAPAPDALADLRAWLPDAAEELPRAC
jgi:hypothetical protein